jgi:hypothetical protein
MKNGTMANQSKDFFIDKVIGDLHPKIQEKLRNRMEAFGDLLFDQAWNCGIEKAMSICGQGGVMSHYDLYRLKRIIPCQEQALAELTGTTED